MGVGVCSHPENGQSEKSRTKKEQIKKINQNDYNTVYESKLIRFRGGNPFTQFSRSLHSSWLVPFVFEIRQIYRRIQKVKYSWFIPWVVEMLKDYFRNDSIIGCDLCEVIPQNMILQLNDLVI